MASLEVRGGEGVDVCADLPAAVAARIPRCGSGGDDARRQLIGATFGGRIASTGECCVPTLTSGADPA
jgi:hypothetical protein